MIVIRFQRTGKKNQPFFRIIVCDKRNAAKAGRSLEVVGFFNPLTKEKNVKADRVKYWLSVGAKPSDRAHNLFVREGIIKADKIAVHAKSKKKEGEKEKGKAEPKPKPAADVKVEEKVEEKDKEKKEEVLEPKKDESKQEEKKEESKPVEKSEKPKEKLSEEKAEKPAKEKPKT